MGRVELPGSSSRDRSYGADFVSGLLDPDTAPPAAITGPQGKAVVKRYGVYRNNVTVGLVNALAAVYPATERITGTDFFRAMARSHVRITPPTSRLLFEYGHDFPDFVERYEPARGLPWLADVTRIERAWLDAYHAADVATLQPAALAMLPPDRLANAVLVPHPGSRIVRSKYSALRIFEANRGSAPLSRIDATEPEDILVTRPSLEVLVRRLPVGGAVFLDHLFTGKTLGVAAGEAIAESGAAFDLAANITGMVGAGVFVAIHGET